ncbi:MAG: DUF1127 domain-containing protein [Rhodospirillales bacterium]|nr:MAG: DUF1127 domain-containing protein [Rhodospirillales bacterium]
MDRAASAARPSLRSILATWRRRVRERDELARMDARERRDIGVTDADVAMEISKPAWRA